MTESLAEQSCTACREGQEALKGGKLRELADRLGEDWTVVDEHHLQRTFTFKNFKEALAFVNRVGEVAEEQNHHPDILLGWGKAEVRVWTHKIDGLTESDFIFAAKTDRAL